MNSVEMEITGAMRSSGITPPDHIIFDGRIHRFGRKKSSWCVFFDGQVKAGAFGDFKLGFTEKFIESRQTLTPMDRKRIGKAMRDAAAQGERELKARYEQGARKCAAIWEETGDE